jgi:hypothetical protein
MIGKKPFWLEPEGVKDCCLRGEQLSHAFVASVCEVRRSRHRTLPAQCRDRMRRGRRVQTGDASSHDPRQVRGASEGPNDRRQCRRHDRLVESGEQHPEHQSAEDKPQPTAVEGHRT